MKAANIFQNNKKLYRVFGLIITLTLLTYSAKYYYLNYVKHAELEEKLIKIHSKMSQQKIKASAEGLDHFGVGLNIRNKYNLWSETSDLRKLFVKHGVHHPDDMSGLIMETYLRSQKGVPFRLHKLIKLYAGLYEADDVSKYLEKLKSEFYRYKEY